MFFKRAKLELYVTDDGLEVKVKSYTPSSGKYSALTEKQVMSHLKKIGIRIDLDHDLINDVVARAVSGNDITGMTILRGIAPRKKNSTVFKLGGNPDFPVFKGMIVGQMGKTSSDIPGKDVFNQTIMPSASKQPEIFKLEKGCIHDEKNNNVLARGYGQVVLSARSLKLKPLHRLSPDKTKVTSVIFHLDFLGDILNANKVIDSLAEMKITDTIKLQTLEAAIAKANKTRRPQIAVIATGKPAVNGRDGFFEPSEAIKHPDVDENDPTANVDFREQSIFRSVKPGTFLGRIHPPRPGEDGYDVFGRIITARHGKPADIYPGENVEITAAEKTDGGVYIKSTSGNDDAHPAGDLTALESGMVVFEKNRISVLDFMRIEGDIDYSTGNINLETGSVEITGTVKEGFKVNSPQHILINENVEEACINAQGNIEVGLGVIMKRSGTIITGGTFRCKFAENAVIKAGESVVFSSNLNNCRVTAGVSIISNGPGIVMGGAMKVGVSMDVGQTGSDYGVKTNIYVGPNPKTVEKLIQEKKIIQEKHAGIKDLLVRQATQNKSGGLSAEQKQQTRELMDKYNSVQNEIKKLDDIIKSTSISEENARKYFVKVRDVAYPGTTIHIAGKTLTLIETLQSPRFYFDFAKTAVVWR